MSPRCVIQKRRESDQASSPLKKELSSSSKLPWSHSKQALHRPATFCDEFFAMDHNLPSQSPIPEVEQRLEEAELGSSIESKVKSSGADSPLHNDLDVESSHKSREERAVSGPPGPNYNFASSKGSKHSLRRNSLEGYRNQLRRKSSRIERRRSLPTFTVDSEPYETGSPEGILQDILTITFLD